MTPVSSSAKVGTPIHRILRRQANSTVFSSSRPKSFRTTIETVKLTRMITARLPNLNLGGGGLTMTMISETRAEVTFRGIQSMQTSRQCQAPTEAIQAQLMER